MEHGIANNEVSFNLEIDKWKFIWILAIPCSVLVIGLELITSDF